MEIMHVLVENVARIVSKNPLRLAIVDNHPIIRIKYCYRYTNGVHHLTDELQRHFARKHCQYLPSRWYFIQFR